MPGIDEATFPQQAEAAKANCPVSKAARPATEIPPNSSWARYHAAAHKLRRRHTN